MSLSSSDTTSSSTDQPSCVQLPLEEQLSLINQSQSSFSDIPSSAEGVLSIDDQLSLDQSSKDSLNDSLAVSEVEAPDVDIIHLRQCVN